MKSSNNWEKCRLFHATEEICRRMMNAARADAIQHNHPQGLARGLLVHAHGSNQRILGQIGQGAGKR